MSRLLPLSSGGESFGEESADHVAAGAAFLLGDGVELGDGLGVEADGVEVSGHTGERSTPLDNVIQRDTVLGMTTTRTDAPRTFDRSISLDALLDAYYATTDKAIRAEVMAELDRRQNNTGLVIR